MFAETNTADMPKTDEQFSMTHYFRESRDFYQDLCNKYKDLCDKQEVLIQRLLK